MSEFNYLTGRKELFDNAPDEAMVVLETNDGQVYYAVSHNRGAKYWYDNGNPGRPIGLIALFEKTRVIASRVRVAGLPPVEPKRDPIPKSRLDRMQQAQDSLKKAVSQPAPVKPKPEPKPSPVKVDPPKVTPKRKTPNVACPKCGVTGIHACTGAPVAWSEQDKLRLADAVEKIRGSEAGFVSIYELSQRGGSRATKTFVTINGNGQLSMSAKLPFVTGDNIDIQIDPTRGLIRLGKVKEGGRPLAKTRMVSFKVLCDLFRIPEGEKSVRVYLTEVDGWWQGEAELVGVKS